MIYDILHLFLTNLVSIYVVNFYPLYQKCDKSSLRTDRMCIKPNEQTEMERKNSFSRTNFT